MNSSRRKFIGVTLGMTATFAAGAAQIPQPRPRSPYGAPPTIPELPGKSNSRGMLKANQEDIKKDIARLSELVSELQKGLDDNDTKDVLSLDVIHKTEEIEKLAKQIRNLVRA